MPVVFAPLGVALLAFGAALFVYILLRASDQTVRPFLEAVARTVPVIGGYIRDAAEAALGWAEGLLSAILAGIGDLAGLFLHAAGDALDFVVGGIVEAVQALADGVVHLREVTIPGLLAVATAELGQAIDTIGARVGQLERGLHAGIDAIDARIGQLAHDLSAGIDRVEARVGQLERAVFDRVDRVLDHLLRDVVPALTGRIDRVTDDLADLRAKLGELAGSIGHYLPWIAAVAGVFTATRAIEALRTAERSKPKLDRLCTLDLGEVDDLLELALVIPSLALILSTTREAAGVMGDILDEIGDALT